MSHEPTWPQDATMPAGISHPPRAASGSSRLLRWPRSPARRR